MSNLKTLIKYEIKKQYPKLTKGKIDIVGFVLSFLVSIAVVGVVILLASVITDKYLTIQVGKVVDKQARALELLNLFYCIAILFLTFACIEKLRKVFTDKTDREIFLKLPISSTDLFLSKFLVVFISNFISSLIFVLPINIIVFIALKPSIAFWFLSLVVILFLPIIVFLIASIFVVPYIKFIEFIKNKYVLIFIGLTIIMIGAFYLYTIFLGVFQGYLETGFIKFLFNEKFIISMQTLLKLTYPTNCLAYILLGKNILLSVLVLVLSAGLCFGVAYVISKFFFANIIFKNEEVKRFYKNTFALKSNSQLTSLVKKEFLTVFREPKHTFAYLVIATAMPVLVYCLYTLFDSLIFNMIGINITFALALMVVLLMSVLTNTFCATNISREGLLMLKQKSLPLKPEKILLSKVIFCAIVSCSSVILSSVILMIFTKVNVWEGLLCMASGIAFSFAQIFLATKIDLKHACLSSNLIEAEKQTTKTILKVVVIGCMVAFIAGFSALIVNIFARGIEISIFAKVQVPMFFTYVIPTLIVGMYIAFSMWYYKHKMQEHFDKLSV